MVFNDNIINVLVDNKMSSMVYGSLEGYHEETGCICKVDVKEYHALGPPQIPTFGRQHQPSTHSHCKGLFSAISLSNKVNKVENFPQH